MTTGLDSAAKERLFPRFDSPFPGWLLQFVHARPNGALQNLRTSRAEVVLRSEHFANGRRMTRAEHAHFTEKTRFQGGTR